jgi:hypothetical protein
MTPDPIRIRFEALSTLTDDEAATLDPLIDTISERIAPIVQADPGTRKNALGVLAVLENAAACDLGERALFNILVAADVIPVSYTKQADGTITFERMD